MEDKRKNTDNLKEKKLQTVNYEDEIFMQKPDEIDEIDSDGSANAFDETESVNEDNFDRLSEK